MSPEGRYEGMTEGMVQVYRSLIDTAERRGLVRGGHLAMYETDAMGIISANGVRNPRAFIKSLERLGRFSASLEMLAGKAETILIFGDEVIGASSEGAGNARIPAEVPRKPSSARGAPSPMSHTSEGKNARPRARNRVPDGSEGERVRWRPQGTCTSGN